MGNSCDLQQALSLFMTEKPLLEVFVLKPTSPKAEADHGLFMHNVSPTYRSVAHKFNVNNS